MKTKTVTILAASIFMSPYLRAENDCERAVSTSSLAVKAQTGFLSSLKTTAKKTELYSTHTGKKAHELSKSIFDSKDLGPNSNLFFASAKLLIRFSHKAVDILNPSGEHRVLDFNASEMVVYDVKSTPDDKYIFIAGTLGLLKVSLETGQLVSHLEFPNRDGDMRALDLSDVNSYGVVASYSGKSYLFDKDTMKVQADFKLDSVPRGINFSADGSAVYAIDRKNKAIHLSVKNDGQNSPTVVRLSEIEFESFEGIKEYASNPVIWVDKNVAILEGKTSAFFIRFSDKTEDPKIFSRSLNLASKKTKAFPIVKDLNEPILFQLGSGGLNVWSLENGSHLSNIQNVPTRWMATTRALAVSAEHDIAIFGLNGHSDLLRPYDQLQASYRRLIELDGYLRFDGWPMGKEDFPIVTEENSVIIYNLTTQKPMGIIRLSREDGQDSGGVSNIVLSRIDSNSLGLIVASGKGRLFVRTLDLRSMSQGNFRIETMDQ